MKRVHQVVGVVTLLVFLATGVYMRTHFPGVYRGDPGIRMQFRASHIYILLTALLNVGIGSYFFPHGQRWRRVLQRVGSSFVLVATLIVIGDFFYEPPRGSMQRPITLLAVVLLLVGTLTHLISGLGQDER